MYILIGYILAFISVFILTKLDKCYIEDVKYPDMWIEGRKGRLKIMIILFFIPFINFILPLGVIVSIITALINGIIKLLNLE
jgi:hypothetical protein